MGIPFILESDASDNGLRAVLSQVQSGKERAIAYAAGALSKAERNYSTTGRNMLVLVLATEHFETFLYGQHCLARTDHSALQWLRNKSCSKINQEFLFVTKVAQKLLERRKTFLGLMRKYADCTIKVRFLSLFFAILWSNQHR